MLGITAALLIAPVLNSLTGKYLVQSPLPITMSVVIGLLQSLLLRKYHRKSLTWLWIYFFSFLVCFASIETISDLIGVKPEVYLPIGVLASTLFTGYLQARIFLGLKGRQVASWTLRTVLSWLTPLALLGIIVLSVPRSAGQLSKVSNMVAVLGGGLIFGLLTKNISRYLQDEGPSSSKTSSLPKKQATIAETTR